MGRWRGRRLFAAPRAAAGAPLCLLAGLAVLVAGCGAEERVNEPRPQPPTRVSVAVADDRITVQPRRIAFGPEPSQQIPQNRNAGQPPVRSDAPLDVVFVVANLTDLDSRLRVRGDDTDATSRSLVANGNISLQAALPTGVYRISAAGIPSAKSATLLVGPYRTSSENDVLLP